MDVNSLRSCFFEIYDGLSKKLFCYNYEEVQQMPLSAARDKVPRSHWHFILHLLGQTPLLA